MGVIDPAKVTRLALQNAASIAALMLTTEALVADIREDKKEAAGAPTAVAAWAAWAEECTKLSSTTFTYGCGLYLEPAQ